MSFLNLLTVKSRIYSIEINDEKINQDIGRLILQIEKNLADLRQVLDAGAVVEKESKAKVLNQELMQIRQEVSTVKNDVGMIINMELQRKEYIVVKDEQFIKDKDYQLKTVIEHLDNLIEIFRETPTNQEYKGGLLDSINNGMKLIEAAIAKIKEDDKQLEKIYKSLSDM